MGDAAPLLEEGLAMFPVGAAGALLLSLDDGDAVGLDDGDAAEELESAGAGGLAGLLQPSRAKDK
ncbi:MAG: hypothetical protein ACRD23_17475 [Terriglobales bacterium]